MVTLHGARILLLTLLLGPAMQSVLAQGNNPAFARVLRDPREQEMVFEAAKRSNVVIDDPCGDAHYSIANQFAVYEPLEFDGSGNLRSGSWKQVINYTGCGVTRTLNVLVSVGDGSRAKAYPLLPGMTHADPRLQLDVFKSPSMQLRVQRWRDPSCTKAYVADTEYVGRETATLPGGRGPPWHEVWTLAACGRSESVDITFSPDATGTSFALALGSSAQHEPRDTPDHPTK